MMGAVAGAAAAGDGSGDQRNVAETAKERERGSAREWSNWGN